MPDWIVQTPVSTVRPTPPKAPAATSTGGTGAVDYIRASSPSNFGTPSWSTDFSSGSVSRSGGTLTLSQSGIWQVSFACRGSCNATAGVVGGVYYSVDGVDFGIALGSYNNVDSVAVFTGSGAMIFEVSGSATVSFSGAGLYPTYDSDTITGEDGVHYMAAHWVGP